MVWAGFIALIALGHTLSAGIAPNRPVEPTRWFRLAFLVFELLNWAADFFLLAVEPGWHLKYQGHILGTMILAAEYAATIRTIPPLSVKKRERVHAQA
jgi:hypothetical protein